jgi:aspartyl protease family protein
MKFPFEKDPESNVIYVTMTLNGKRRFKMLIDTGASVTTIDPNALLMAGLDLNKAGKIIPVETANGVMEVDLFDTISLSAMGITRQNMSVLVHDFLIHNILSNYDGLLGMDFFEGTQFTINMVENTIVVESLQ